MVCGRYESDTRFTCDYHTLGCVTGYGGTCDCEDEMPCVPAGALIPAQYWYGGLVACPTGASSCHTKWCTVGGNPNECVNFALGIFGYPDMPECVQYFEPGTAPAGFEDLGICMKPDIGPCAGLTGIECASS
jgi:hypothetical protein